MRENGVGLVEINLGDISEALFFSVLSCRRQNALNSRGETKIVERHSEETIYRSD